MFQHNRVNSYNHTPRASWVLGVRHTCASCECGACGACGQWVWGMWTVLCLWLGQGSYLDLPSDYPRWGVPTACKPGEPWAIDLSLPVRAGPVDFAGLGGNAKAGLHVVSVQNFRSTRKALKWWELLGILMHSVLLVQSLSRFWLFATPWTAAHQAPLSSTISWSLLKFLSIESVILSNCLILCHPLGLLPSIFPSIRVFSNESALHIRWPKYWSFSFSVSPSSEYSGLISFRIDWFDLLSVQGTLKLLWKSKQLRWDQR